MVRQKAVKRFSVSLGADEYERLRDLAARQRPPLRLSYVVAYAVHQLLQQADAGQLPLDFGRPVPRREER